MAMTAPAPTELLPCPFCGGEPDLSFEHGAHPDWWKVTCTGCGCRTISNTTDRQKVVDSWNTRQAASVERAEVAGEAVVYRVKYRGSFMYFEAEHKPAAEFYAQGDNNVEPLYASPPRSEGVRGCEVQSDEVLDTWFVDRRLPIMAMSGDIESDRVLKLHFRHKVTDADRKRPTEVLNAGEVALGAAQASIGPREVLDALADKVAAKIGQLEHYKANDCQLDHARTIAEGRISQANQILHWIAEAAVGHSPSVPSAECK